MLFSIFSSSKIIRNAKKLYDLLFAYSISDLDVMISNYVWARHIVLDFNHFKYEWFEMFNMLGFFTVKTITT